MVPPVELHIRMVSIWLGHGATSPGPSEQVGGGLQNQCAIREEGCVSGATGRAAHENGVHLAGAWCNKPWAIRAGRRGGGSTEGCTGRKQGCRLGDKRRVHDRLALCSTLLTMF